MNRFRLQAFSSTYRVALIALMAPTGLRMRQTACFLSLLFIVCLSKGQGVIAFAPWEMSAKVSSISKLGAIDPLLSIRRVVPVETLLPQVTGDSFIHVLGIALGPRVIDSEYDRLRLRLTGAEIFMQRAYTSGSFTLLDFNRTGVTDEQTTWIGASFGPGIHVGEGSLGAWFRGSVGGRLTTQKSGTLLFPESLMAKSVETGLGYSLSLQAGIRFNRIVQFQAAHTVYRLGAADFDQNLWMLEAKVRINPRYQLVVEYEKGIYELGSDRKKVGQLSGAIRFTPSARAF